MKECYSLQEIKISGTNNVYSIETQGGLIENKNNEVKLIVYPYAKKDIQKYIVPEDVTIIEGYALYQTHFAYVKMNEKVKRIGEYAMRNATDDNIDTSNKFE